MSLVRKIVILGGGFGGTAVAARLERIFRRDLNVKVTLVDQENFALFTPLLPEVTSGAIEPKHIVSPLRALLRRTQIVHADVKAVDLSKRIVIAAHCPQCELTYLKYDHLVIALGSVTNFFSLPGLARNAFTMKTLADATRLHAHVIDKFEHADLATNPSLRRELLTFVIAGGGFAGIETAAELNDFVRDACHYYPRVQRGDVRVVLVHLGPRILPEVSDSLSTYALEKLRSRGVEVRLATGIDAYKDDCVHLSSKEQIRSRTLIWTAGIMPNPLLGALKIAKTGDGKTETNEYMQIQGHPDVWAVGDSAHIPDRNTGRAYPPTAQHAIREGCLVAENIAAVLSGRDPKPFCYKPLGVLASLGKRTAVAEILGFKFSGFVAWWLWRTAYLLKLPGMERKVRVALDWTLDLFFPRDVVYLKPLHFAHPSEIKLEEESPSPSLSGSSVRQTSLAEALLKGVNFN